MFISRKLIFVELQKTGSTHIQKILTELLDGKLVGKHNQVNKNQFLEGRVFLGSIRDPWEWYISLWAYGCDKKGALFERLIQRDKSSIKFEGMKRNPYDFFINILNLRGNNKWMDVYRDVNDVAAFREWLSMMHNRRYIDDIGEGYRNCSINRSCGLMTYRYLMLFCNKGDGLEDINKLSKYSKILEYEKDNCFIDFFIRNEKLESDLFFALEKTGEVYSSEVRFKIASMKKTNTSSRKVTIDYYDDKSENIVKERERLIIEKFKYKAPSFNNNF